MVTLCMGSVLGSRLAHSMAMESLESDDCTAPLRPPSPLACTDLCYLVLAEPRRPHGKGKTTNSDAGCCRAPHLGGHLTEPQSKQWLQVCPLKLAESTRPYGKGKKIMSCPSHKVVWTLQASAGKPAGAV